MCRCPQYTQCVMSCCIGPSGGEWTLLSEEVTDSFYEVKDLPRGASYVFRVGCINKTGTGPLSDASAPVVLATHPQGRTQQTIIITLLSNVLFHEHDHYTCTPFLLCRDSHPSGPDRVEGVKGYWIQTSNYAEELQSPF